MSTLGWIHTVFGLVALLVGTAVALTRKGTHRHRTLGYVYLTSMLALNATALLIYDLFGRFGPFHWMAVASLITLLAGMVPVLARRPKDGWLDLHAGFISGSYVGLVAAFAAEITSRLPGGGSGFSGPAAAVTTVVVITIGAIAIRRSLPTSTGRAAARLREVSPVEN
jgi:uncharacterized membrane protein